VDYDKLYARSGYESLILKQPHIRFEGLWEVGGRYYIVCPSLDSEPKSSSGRPISDWFHNECRIVGSPVSLVNKIPEGAIKIPERTAVELSLLHGEPLTVFEVYREISNSLPRTFPLLGVSSPGGNLIIEVSRRLSDEEVGELDIVLSNYKIDIEYDIKVKCGAIRCEDKWEVSNPNASANSLDLLPVRSLQSSLPATVASAYEEDEEFWIDNRVSLLSSNDLRREDVLPDAFMKGASCLIDATVFDTNNLRAYLPIYRRLIIVMPLKKHLDKALNGFGVSKKEIIELVSRGRVQFVLPQPIQRYDAGFIAEIKSARSSAVLLSRRLSIASVIETRSRVPFLYPALGSAERRALIEAFSSVKNIKIGGIARVLGKSLGVAWSGMERNLSARGAMGTMTHGVGPLLGELAHGMTGRDLTLEITTSSMSVEWAAALRSTYFPVETNDYSSYAAANLCASLYSGVRNSPTVNPVKDFQSFVTGILTLDNDAPILELDSALTSRDTDQLADLLNRAHSQEERQSLIDKMNGKIRQYESVDARLKRLDIFSLGGAVAGVITGNAYISLGVWIVQYILAKADPSIDFGGRMLDWARAVNTHTSADVVLLSRIRNKVNSITNR